MLWSTTVCSQRRTAVVLVVARISLVCFGVSSLLISAPIHAADVASEEADATSEKADVTSEEFASKAPSSWASYRKRFNKWKRSVSGTVKSKARMTVPTESLVWDWSIEIVTQGDLVRLDSPWQVYDGKPDGTIRLKHRMVLCLNDEYAFRLTSGTIGDGADVLRVSRLEHPPGDGVRFHVEKILEHLKWASLVELPMIGLPELYSHPGFHVVSVDRGGDRVRVEFTLDGDKDRNWGLKSGVLVLDPKNDWCLRDAQLTVFLEGGWVSTVVAFEPVAIGSDGILVSTHSVQKYRSAHYCGEEAYEMKLQRNAVPVEQNTFRLSAFGLEEPVFD